MAAKKSKKAKTAKKKASSKAKKAAPKKVSPIPKGYHTATPYLVCRDAAGALEFYKKALGAKEKIRMGSPDGKVMHAEITLGDSIIMLGEEAPERGALSPKSLNGTASSVMLYVPNVDKAFERMEAAGAKTEMPPMDMFWGDRYATMVDPFGHKWSLATHIKDLTPKQMAKATDEFMAQQAAQAAEKP
jgi:uncharacterized glyoxalase superfamily protein PhnB